MWSCWNTVPQIGWHRNNRNWFLPFLEAGCLRSGCAGMVRFCWEISSGLQTDDYSLYLHMEEREWESSLGSLLEGQRPHSWQLHPQVLITFQRSHVPISSQGELGFSHRNLGKTHSVRYNTQHKFFVILCWQWWLWSSKSPRNVTVSKTEQNPMFSLMAWSPFHTSNHIHIHTHIFPHTPSPSQQPKQFYKDCMKYVKCCALCLQIVTFMFKTGGVTNYNWQFMNVKN